MKKLIILCSIVFTIFVSSVIVNAAIPAQVSVSISSSIDNGNKNVGGISQNKSVGDVLDLDASTLNESNEFAYWVINGFVRTDLGATVQLRVQSKMSAQAIFHTSGEHAVLFMDSNGKLIDHIYVVDGESVTAPTTTGYSKPGGLVVDTVAPWKTLDGSTTSLEGIDSSRIYVLQYTQPSKPITILVEGGTDEAITANINDVVTVTASNLSTFKYWADEDGNVLSYNSTYSFTALEDVIIKAKDTTVTPKSFVTMKDLTGIRSGYESYVGRFELHGDDEIIEYGFIMSSTEVGAITVDSTGVQFAKSNTHNPVTNEFLMSFPLVNFLSIRAYALINNADGLTYIYNELSGSFARDLFISEYIEGTSNNKAIEIYNGTGASVDLSSYKLSLFSNGATEPGYTIELTGTLANGDVYVIYNSGSDTAIIAKGDIDSTVTYFNGDDAIALYKNNNIIDVFGVIGTDPGASWVVGTGKTADNTLVRKSSVTGPSPSWNSSEWDVHSVDTFTYLGSHLIAGSAFVLSDSQSILLDAMNLNEFAPINQNGTITLPIAGDNGTTISWSSDSSDIINSETKDVVIPEGQPETVVLTATIYKGGLSKSVIRNVVVGLTYEERVAADKESLALESLTINEAGTIALPATGSVHGSVISWASSNTDIINGDGVVTLPASGSVDVILTATITYGEGTPFIDTKQFTVNVSSEALENKELVYTFTSLSWASTESGSGSSESNPKWLSIKAGNQLTSGQGVQITTGVTGAGAKLSDISNIVSVEIMYATNASKGAGNIVTTIGGNQVNKFSVTTTGGTTPRTAGIVSNTNNFSGDISFVVNCTTNSIYIHSIKIIYLG